MSIAVLITYLEDIVSPGPDYLPLATEDVFATHWLPAAATSNCVWMPLFQSGAPVPIEDIPTVLDEFRRLRNQFAVVVDGSTKADVRERSAWLIDELEKIDLSTIKSMFIG